MSTEEKKETTEPKAEAPTPAAPTFVFGSGVTSGGFSAFAAAAPKPAAPAGEEEEGGEAEADPEAECKAEFKPVVQLEEVETSTGEEEENALFNAKSKLYRWDASSNEWKERGIGQVRILEHKENKRIRLLMREEKTLKIRANHLIIPGTTLKQHQGNDKSWVWTTVDFADEVQKTEKFCLRVGKTETAAEFKRVFEEAGERNAKTLGLSAEADSLAEQLEKTAVDEK